MDNWAYPSQMCYQFQPFAPSHVKMVAVALLLTNAIARLDTEAWIAAKALISTFGRKQTAHSISTMILDYGPII